MTDQMAQCVCNGHVIAALITSIGGKGGPYVSVLITSVDVLGVVACWDVLMKKQQVSQCA